MTDRNPTAQTPVEIEDAAASWLERKNFAQWREADQAELEEWLAASWSHRVAFWRLETAWSRAERLTALRNPARTKIEPAKKAGPSLLLRAASAMLIAAIAGVWGYTQFERPNDTRYATGLGERKTLQLADGSRIELNTATTLRVSRGSDHRTVWLDKGEAYFDIKHNAANPFTVFAAGHRISDLGTKFSVRSDANRLKVSLVEGLARIDDANGASKAASAILSPGDVALATATSLKVVKKPEQELRDQLGWRRGLLVFVHATLADVAAEFNRYNETKIVIADPAVAQRRIGATFPSQDLEDFAVLARTSLRLHVEQRDGNIIISR